jgi:hypothetical protein
MRLRFQLLIVMVLRTIINTMHRMVYPFLGTFARGLGVDITALSFALTGRLRVATPWCRSSVPWQTSAGAALGCWPASCCLPWA